MSIVASNVKAYIDALARVTRNAHQRLHTPNISPMTPAEALGPMQPYLKLAVPELVEDCRSEEVAGSTKTGPHRTMGQL
jgi:hypothetical protein